MKKLSFILAVLLLISVFPMTLFAATPGYSDYDTTIGNDATDSDVVKFVGYQQRFYKDGDNKLTDVRFIALIDGLNYSKVGYYVSTDAGTSANIESSKVYSGITANGVNKTAADLGGSYISIVSVTGIEYDSETTFYVTPYAVSADETAVTIGKKGNLTLENLVDKAMDFSLADDDWSCTYNPYIMGDITDVKIGGTSVAYTQDAFTKTLTITGTALTSVGVTAGENKSMVITTANGDNDCNVNIWTNIITTAEEFVMIEGYTYENLNQDGAKIIKGNSSDAMKGLYMLAADIDLTNFKNYTLNGKSYFRGIGVAAYDEEYAAANSNASIKSILKPSDTDGTARHDSATGENGYGFQGVIDGRGHTVTASFEQGFHYNTADANSQLWNVCIIGNLYKNATIKNTGFILNVNTTVKLRRCSPIGYVNGGTVSNCYSKIVFGANSGVSLNAQKDTYQYGGITSWTAGNATIKDCVAVFDTSAVTNVPATLTLGNHGGIIGYITDNTTKVENCYFYQNKGSVTADYNLVGNVSTDNHTLVTGDATATSQSVATIAGSVTETNGFDMSIWSVDSEKLYFGAKEIV